MLTRPGRRLRLAPRANRPRLAIFLDLPGRREPARRGAGRGVPRPRPSRARARPLRPARPAQPRCCTAPRPKRAAARLPGPARPHDRDRRQRRGLQPLGLSRGRHPRPAPRAPAGRLRRRPRARAARAAGRLERRARLRRVPAVGTFHAYSTKAMPNHIATPARRPARLQPALGPDRRLRGRRLDRPPLVRRPLRDRPQRRRRRRRAERPRSRRARSCGSLFVGRPEERKGLPVLLDRLRRAGRARALPADRDRRRARGRRSATSPIPRRCASIDVRGRVSGDRALAAACTRPTCSARRRSRARASAWS